MSFTQFMSAKRSKQNNFQEKQCRKHFVFTHSNTVGQVQQAKESTKLSNNMESKCFRRRKQPSLLCLKKSIQRQYAGRARLKDSIYDVLLSL